MAVSEGLLDLPVLYMRSELESRKDECIDLMYAVSARGAWAEWLNVFLGVAALRGKRTVRAIDKVLALQGDYGKRAKAVSRSTNLLGLIAMIFKGPVVQAKTVAAKVAVTDAGARNLIRQPVDLGILVEVPGVYPTAWMARELIDISRPDAP